MADGVCRFLYRLHLGWTLGGVFRVATCQKVRTIAVRRGICSFSNRDEAITDNIGHAKQAEATQQEFIRGYEDIPELENAPENVKRIFRLSNANQLEQRKVAKEEIKELFGGKKEQHIAELTLKINTLLKHCEEKPKDKHNKVFLQWLTDQRKKKLKSFKTSQFKHYLELIKQLDIPPLESPHSKWNKYKFRQFKLGVNVEKKQSFLERKMIK